MHQIKRDYTYLAPIGTLLGVSGRLRGLEMGREVSQEGLLVIVLRRRAGDETVAGSGRVIRRLVPALTRVRRRAVAGVGSLAAVRGLIRRGLIAAVLIRSIIVTAVGVRTSTAVGGRGLVLRVSGVEVGLTGRGIMVGLLGLVALIRIRRSLVVSAVAGSVTIKAGRTIRALGLRGRPIRRAVVVPISPGPRLPRPFVGNVGISLVVRSARVETAIAAAAAPVIVGIRVPADDFLVVPVEHSLLDTHSLEQNGAVRNSLVGEEVQGGDGAVVGQVRLARFS